MKNLSKFLLILLMSFSAVAQEKVSALPTVTSVAGTDYLYLITGSAPFLSRKVTFQTTKQAVYAGINGVGAINSSGNLTINNGAITSIMLASGISATKIADGSVGNAQYQYLGGVTSDIQTQINGKQATGNYITGITGDLVATGPGSVASTIQANAVTFSKIQNIPTNTLLGRSTAGSGNVENITVGSGLNLSSGTLSATGGTVTTLSVATANGMAGTVANPTTTPQITLSVPTTGVLKSDGTSLSTAIPGTDYLTPTDDGSGLTNLTAANIGAGTAPIDITGSSGTTGTINGQVVQGTNITITGTGTTGSPLVINSTASAPSVNLVNAVTQNSNTPYAANVGTGETTLYTYVIPANTLTANGDSYRFVTWGYNVSNPTGTEEIFAYLNGVNAYDGNPLTITNNVGWQLEITIFRTGVSEARVEYNFSGVTGFGQEASAGNANVSIAADWTSNMPFTLTAQASGTGAASNQILIWSAKSYIEKF